MRQRATRRRHLFGPDRVAKVWLICSERCSPCRRSSRLVLGLATWELVSCRPGCLVGPVAPRWAPFIVVGFAVVAVDVRCGGLPSSPSMHDSGGCHRRRRCTTWGAAVVIVVARPGGCCCHRRRTAWGFPCRRCTACGSSRHGQHGGCRRGLAVVAVWAVDGDGCGSLAGRVGSLLVVPDIVGRE